MSKLPPINGQASAEAWLAFYARQSTKARRTPPKPIAPTPEPEPEPELVAADEIGELFR